MGGRSESSNKCLPLMVRSREAASRTILHRMRGSREMRWNDGAAARDLGRGRPNVSCDLAASGGAYRTRPRPTATTGNISSE